MLHITRGTSKTVICTFLIAGIFACRTPSKAYESEIKNWGYDNIQADLSFHGYFLMPPADPSDDEEVDAEKVDQRASDTLEYLFGALRVHKAFIANPGIPLGDPKWTITGMSPVEVDGIAMRKVEYDYKDLALFRKSMFPSWDAKQVRIVVPKDIDALYNLSLIDSVDNPDGKKKINACTDDPNYDSKSDFFYFWDPDRKGCPKDLKDKATIQVLATLKPVPNTAVTFPEYGRLGTDKDIHVFVVQGIYKILKEDPSNKNGPGLIDEKDPGFPAFQNQKAELERIGFVPVKIEKRRAIYSLTKYTGQKVTVEIAFLSPSKHSRKPDREAFTEFYRRAVSEGDIVIYNGHSGLGGTLRPSRFESADTPLSFNDKYQVFFFNGCSTYAYYRGSYMKLKGGSKNLDTISSGIESFFVTQPYVTSTAIEELAVLQQNSWQQVIANIYFAPSRGGIDLVKFSANYSVNGDEDNPTNLTDASRRPKKLTKAP